MGHWFGATCTYYCLYFSKISQYSPSEVAKVYEKTATRRSNTHFNPKATLTRLKQGEPPDGLDGDGRKDLISQYLDVRILFHVYFNIRSAVVLIVTCFFACSSNN